MDLSQTPHTSEGKRLRESNAPIAHWNRWGLYLSERDWGTVRENYNSSGGFVRNGPNRKEVR